MKTQLLRNGVEEELQKNIDKKKTELEMYMKQNGFE